MPVRVEGLLETQDYFYAIGIALNKVKLQIVDEFCKKIAHIAQRKYPKKNIETGALLESVGNRILRSTAEEVIGEVFIGSPTVIRGEGRFQVSRKTHKKVSPRATEEYAEYAKTSKGGELIANVSMDRAYQWALQNVDREIDRILRVILR